MNNPKGQYMVEKAHPIDVHHEHAKAISVRSGRVVNNKVEELRSKESKPIVGVMNSRDKAVKASKGDHVPSSSTSSFYSCSTLCAQSSISSVSKCTFSFRQEGSFNERHRGDLQIG